MTDYFTSKKYHDSKERIEKAFNFEIDDFSQMPSCTSNKFILDYRS